MQQPNEIELFLEFLHDERTGYLELCYAPSDPSEGVTRDRWYQWPRQKQAFLDRAAQLVERFGDVYTSLTLYPTKARENPLPTNIIFVDDAPAPDAASLPYSHAIQTSAGSYHACYKVSQALDNAQRYGLASRALALLCGDKTGKASKKLVRLPCSFNTKRGGRFPVSTVAVGGPIYTIEHLESALPPSSPLALGAGASGLALDWEAIEAIDVDALLENGLPRRITKPNIPTAKILRGVEYPYAEQYKALGDQYGFGPDFGKADTSKARFTVALGLAEHGYPQQEIAALLLHFCNWRAGRKGLRWLQADIERCITTAIKYITDKGRIYKPSVSHVNGKQAAQQAPAGSKRGRGRPRKHPAAMLADPQRPRKVGRPIKMQAPDYLRWLYDNRSASNQLLGTRKENAQQLGLSVPTIDRYESRLRALGLIERVTNKRRSDSWIVLEIPKIEAFLGAIKIQENTQNTLENASNSAVLGVLSARAEYAIDTPNVAKNNNRSTHPPIHTPLAPSYSSSLLSNESNEFDAQPVALDRSNGGISIGACVPPETSQLVEPAQTGEPTTLGASYSPRPAQQAPAPSLLAVAVRSAIETIPSLYEKPDKETGEIKRGNVTQERVRAFVRSYSPALSGLPDNRIDRALKRERQQDTAFAKAKVAALSASDSDVQARVSRLRKTVPSKVGQQRAGYWRVMLTIWLEEHGRRGLPQLDAPKAQASKGSKRKRSTAPVIVEQPTILDLLDGVEHAQRVESPSPSGAARLLETTTTMATNNTQEQPEQDSAPTALAPSATGEAGAVVAVGAKAAETVAIDDVLPFGYAHIHSILQADPSKESSLQRYLREKAQQNAVQAHNN